MTDPTQAHIEAALDEALYSLCCDNYEEQQAVAARLKPLTAAAGVGQEAKDILHDRDSSWMDAGVPQVNLGTTANTSLPAAGVGDDAAIESSANELIDQLGRERDVRFDTIERCAQVADGMAYVETCADDTANGTANAAPYRKVATAIRALKDEPCPQPKHR